MVHKDVIFEKVKNIQNSLRRIHEKTASGGPHLLKDMDVQDVVVLNLQRAAQSAIDLAAHVVSDEGLGLPDEIRENFSILQKAGILSEEISAKMQNMVGFRNVAVHDYTAIDADVVQSILDSNLKDLEDFYTAILKYFKLA